MSFFDRERLARELAATYEGGRQVDPWERVQDYRRYLDHTAEHPDQGSSAAAAALELPRGRVRAWMNDSKPDPVRAIEIAEQYDWLDITSESETFQALNILVAWIFSGGSITEMFVPRLAVDDESLRCAETAFRTAGLTDTEIVRTDETNRATEVVPHADGSVLGRFLTVLGAPKGEKNERQPLSLPEYLKATSWERKRDFAQVYVWNRGTERPDRENIPLQIREARSDRYRSELFELLEEVVPNAIQYRGETFALSKPAAGLLDQPPALCQK